MFRTSGVAIPVFSLRTESSMGVGEFRDIEVLVDWCDKAGLKIIQVCGQCLRARRQSPDWPSCT
jgi:4-alpha-glucanotransferase